MGHIEKTFAELKTEPSNGMNGSMFTVEIAENYHIHYRNYRLVMNKKEFMYFMAGMKQALQKWQELGSPDANPNQPVDTPPTYLLNLGIEPIRSEPAKNEEWRKIMVELQKYAEWAQRDDFMHLHYKDLRIDLTINEFLEFASIIADAKNHLTTYLRQKRGQVEGETILDVGTEIKREGRGLAMVFKAEVDLSMILNNWNSMYTKEQIAEREQCKSLQTSLKTEGMKKPLRYALLMGNNSSFGVLLDGHHRAIAASKIGWSRILVQFEVWTDNTIKTIDDLKYYMNETFDSPQMVEKAFTNNKIKLENMEDLIW